MESLHGFLHDIKWIIFHGHLDYFQKPPLGGRLNTKLEDHGTPKPRWFIILHSWESSLYCSLLNIISVFTRALTSLHCCGFEFLQGWASSPGPAIMACQVQGPKDRHLDLGLNFWCPSQIVCTYLLGIRFRVLFLIVDSITPYYFQWSGRTDS
jgi:hypothetical protein